jgi:hypothetical protein
MLEEELRKADGLAAAPHLLDERDRVEMGIFHEVAAETRGVGHLHLRLWQGDQLLEIEGGAEQRLAGEATDRLAAAGGVVGELADEAELNINALFVETRAGTSPVSQQPWL